MKKKGFTLIELLVVIAIIAMLLAILMPALNKVKKIAQRVICGTNLKGLGTAQTVYANDYDDEYAVQGRGAAHIWSTGTDQWQISIKDWSVGANLTVGASLYLLVREADVSPKSFVCPSTEQSEFSGKNLNNLDIVELWDFGNPNWPAAATGEGPIKCVSYSYHMPYAAGQTPAPASTATKGKYAPDARRSAAFAVMADKNPYFESKLFRGGASSATFMDRVAVIGGPTIPTDYSKVDRWGIFIANAYPHGREGQNVTYADGHNSWETRSDVGVKNDEIYTRWSTTVVDAVGTYNRRGFFPNAPLTDFAPLSGDDSVLVNDGPLCPTP
jgi:prepilin-type N-terminal cleavage/methylation domain-containing protein